MIIATVYKTRDVNNCIGNALFNLSGQPFSTASKIAYARLTVGEIDY